MSRAKLRNIWLQLPAWGALLLSGGALIGGARADIKPQPPSRSALGPHEVAVKMDGENLYISQDGSNFEELRLGNTPEAVHFRKLLRDEGSDGRSVAVPVGSMIVASGGGSGKGKKPQQDSGNTENRK